MPGREASHEIEARDWNRPRVEVRGHDAHAGEGRDVPCRESGERADEFHGHNVVASLGEGDGGLPGPAPDLEHGRAGGQSGGDGEVSEKRVGVARAHAVIERSGVAEGAPEVDAVRHRSSFRLRLVWTSQWSASIRWRS